MIDHILTFLWHNMRIFRPKVETRKPKSGAPRLYLRDKTCLREAGPHSGRGEDNRFIGVKTAHHAAGKGSIQVSGDRYKGVPKPTKTTEGARITS